MKKQSPNDLLRILEARFEKHMRRHEGITWADVHDRLRGNTGALVSLGEMEATGGEPDVIERDTASGAFLFCDCAVESPAGRRSLCYDREALNARKENKPGGNAVDVAAAIGIELMTEAEYRRLQALGEFDTKTSSWIKTPPAIRALGGALFCDRRYNTVFTYHNGVQSYYAARGFRGILRV